MVNVEIFGWHPRRPIMVNAHLHLPLSFTTTGCNESSGAWSEGGPWTFAVSKELAHRTTKSVKNARGSPSQPTVDQRALTKRWEFFSRGGSRPPAGLSISHSGTGIHDRGRGQPTTRTFHLLSFLALRPFRFPRFMQKLSSDKPSDPTQAIAG